MAKDTKERILAKALELFSQKGYEGTNIQEIMVSLGLVKSAMYRHFESKEEIWNTLLDRLIVYYEERFGSPERLPPVPESLEELFAKLDRIMENMERRDISLEDSFRDYQEGIRLLKQCNSKIDRIEKKILVMNGDGGFDEFQ